jgi:hypothetical protein
MKDQPRGTRDLAGTSETDVSDSQAADDLGTDQDASTGQSDDRPTARQRAAADEPLSRSRSESGEEDGSPERRDPDAQYDRALDSPSTEDEQGVASGPTASSPREDDSLLPGDQTERFTARWQEIQTKFVDEPRDSVAEADTLVADLMQRLAAGFSKERERLEAQWGRGDDVSTEDLRVVLTRYRSFFDRLLSA